MTKIKYIAFDIDGTLTDGKIYISDKGEMMKAFDIKDGYSIYHLSDYGIVPIVITGRKSEIVANRCKELRIELLYQGVSNKLELLQQIINDLKQGDPELSLSNFAYMGDDIPDMECMKCCGLSGCPADAISSVIDISDFIAPHKSGEGAARDFIEFIVKMNNKESLTDKSIKERLDEAIDYISKLDYDRLTPGKYEVAEDFYYTVKEYDMPADKESRYESHREYIDIQWMCEGFERLYVTDVSELVPSDEYNKEKDIIHYHKFNNLSSMIMQPGSCAVLFPKDAHKSESFLQKDSRVKKIIGKLKIR